MPILQHHPRSPAYPVIGSLCSSDPQPPRPVPFLFAAANRPTDARFHEYLFWPAEFSSASLRCGFQGSQLRFVCLPLGETLVRVWSPGRPACSDESVNPVRFEHPPTQPGAGNCPSQPAGPTIGHEIRELYQALPVAPHAAEASSDRDKSTEAFNIVASSLRCLVYFGPPGAPAWQI